ncbi:clathrin heavy chain binding protein [Aureococcus anophagefferens]|nr:clathrin heavy chain binding protein [Aureococcus anophagefferens]
MGPSRWLAVALAAARSGAMVHDLKIHGDERSLYRIESFCFLEGGVLDLRVTNFKIDAKGPFRAGFWRGELVRQHRIEKAEEGLYSLIFVRCEPSEGRASTSFDLEAKFYNKGPSYLSACEAPLPMLFAVFFGRGGHARVHGIHKLMGALLVLKSLTMMSQAMRYHFINVTGSGEGWEVVYYVFASAKGVMLFVVILLIGTGWSLVKPYLNDREKKIVLVVLVLQVVDNVALVVFEETAPGSQRWLTWRDVLHLVDIICCCAILFPIVWSIRHLREAAAADGKTRNNIAKLTLFRQFYIMVVTYIYFTRIVVFLLAATLPFQWLWLRYVFSEGATLLFYVVAGYKFRPAEDNPYLPLKKGDGDLEEFGIDDDEDNDPELQKAKEFELAQLDDA